MSFALTLHVEVPRAEVLRYMGYPRAKTPSGPVLARLEAIWDRAASLLDARGAFVLVDGTVGTAVGMPSPTERIALGVCTAGARLEEEQDCRFLAGETLDALILDAFGSAAAEASACALQALVCLAAKPHGLTALGRVSPGYGAWNVQRQRDLLAHLPITELGIRLTEGHMMVPRKSVSFAALLVSEGQDQSHHPRRSCTCCELKDCRYRRVHEEPPGT